MLDSTGVAGEASADRERPLRGSLTLEYEAVTSDGHYVVTFVSTTANSAADEEATRRIFYGPPARMEEARPRGVDYSCARYISFELDGTPCSV